MKHISLYMKHKINLEWDNTKEFFDWWYFMMLIM